MSLLRLITAIYLHCKKCPVELVELVEWVRDQCPACSQTPCFVVELSELPTCCQPLLFRGEETGIVHSLSDRAFRDRRQDDRRQDDRHRRDILDSTEIPAEHIDPAAIDLTPLVNTLINTSQSVSSIKNLESGAFRRRFCYCVTNETNDLTDFTAILLDVMGNSTSYLHELFKSASILSGGRCKLNDIYVFVVVYQLVFILCCFCVSVSQRNNSDCIYICVMAGREVSELWEFDSITPLYNQTIMEGPHRAVISFLIGSSVSPTGVDEAVAMTAKITTARPPTTSRRPTTVMSQSQATADGRPQTKATEKTATMIRPITSTQPAATAPRVTTASVTTAAAPTTARPRPTRLTTTTTFSPVISPTRLTTTTTAQLTARPTARPTVALSRRPPTSNTPVEQPASSVSVLFTLCSSAIMSIEAAEPGYIVFGPDVSCLSVERLSLEKAGADGRLVLRQHDDRQRSQAAAVRPRAL
ncbi:HERV-H LTR-associating protein 1 [Nibea albiflora]|uniref:HERV-H LTR-associating protein 1 n=1 Tax=Nibea albiflora TaxID=240163 RepID=A0ACB7FIC8_NIBAL|nr:HERV-H LTR-associating protein 1 [Nibea albiflora]